MPRIDLATAWGGLLVFDVFVYFLTLGRAFSKGLPSGRSVLQIILRDSVFANPRSFLEESADECHLPPPHRTPPSIVMLMETKKKLLAAFVISKRTKKLQFILGKA